MGGSPFLYRSRYGDSIASLLARQGEIAARGAAASGDIWGRAVGQLGQIGAGFIQEQAAANEQRQSAELFNQIISDQELMSRPQEAFMSMAGIIGPERTATVFDALGRWQQLQQETEAAGQLDPGQAADALPSLVRGMMAAPEETRSQYYPAVRDIARTAYPNFELPEAYDPEVVDPIARSFLEGPDYGTPEWQAQASPEALGVYRQNLAADVAARQPPRPPLTQIEAEAEARARGQRRGAPPIAPRVDEEALQPLAQGIADYSIRPSASLLRSNEGRIIMAQVRRINPTYDQTKFDARSALRKDFTSGRTGNNIDALNTAVDHLATLGDLAENLAQGRIPAVNAIVNQISTQLGRPEVTSARAAATAVESEVASLLKKTGATDPEIDRWRAVFDPRMSPQQWQAAVNTVLEIMRGRERALQHRWTSGMETDTEYPIYGAEQQDILDALGYFGSAAESNPMADLARALAALPPSERSQIIGGQ